MVKKRIVLTVGCRPDCIKMMPLVKELKKRDGVETILLSTGQHRQMLDQVFDVFGEKPDYDLKIMKPGQSLFDITTNILSKIQSSALNKIATVRFKKPWKKLNQMWFWFMVTHLLPL